MRIYSWDDGGYGIVKLNNWFRKTQLLKLNQLLPNSLKLILRVLD